MKECYRPIVEAVEAAGFFVGGVQTVCDWERLLIGSRRIGERILSGNSYWISCIDADWFVGSWGGLVYRFSDSKIINDFCIAALQGGFNSSGSDFFESIKADFGLILQQPDET